MFFLLGLLGAGSGAAAGSAMEGGTAAALAGAAMGAGVGLGVAGAVRQHQAYAELRRMRETALGEVKEDGERKLPIGLQNFFSKLGYHVYALNPERCGTMRNPVANSLR
jgi:membrane protease subunit (stomatin/prohibitin family)